jgi:hypothetical protein
MKKNIRRRRAVVCSGLVRYCAGGLSRLIYLLRRFFSKDAPKIMDYIYLSVASLGLLGASDITISEFASRRNESADTIVQALKYIDMLATRDAPGLCARGSIDCTTFKQIEELSRQIPELIAKEEPRSDTKSKMNALSDQIFRQITWPKHEQCLYRSTHDNLRPSRQVSL